MRAVWVLGLVMLPGCADPGFDLGGPSTPDETDAEDRQLYLTDAEFRREILYRDMVEIPNPYGNSILIHYSIPGEGWELHPIRDLPSAPLTVELAADIMSTGRIEFDAATAAPLVPQLIPETRDGWIELGRRAFHEYPAAVGDSDLENAVRQGRLGSIGLVVADDVYNGVRLVEIDGEARIAVTCSICHSSIGPDGELSPVLANREFDLGGLRLSSQLDESGHLVPGIGGLGEGDWARLGRGRSDPQPDGTFNPYAFPDLGGIKDMPYLHHTINWRNRATATLAVRVEITFFANLVESSRVPRELSWAVAEYLRSLPPPPPSDPGDGPLVTRGAQVFSDQGCDGCHEPPHYTSDRFVKLGEIGTDPLAGKDSSRGTGHYRIPSLRGVGRTAPYLHHGAFVTLEDMFDPDREEPGHTFGLTLGVADREALIRFLRSI